MTITAAPVFKKMREMRERVKLDYSSPCSRMMTIRIGSTHWK